MSVYPIVSGVTATQAITVLGGGKNPIAEPKLDGPVPAVPTSLGLQVTVTGSGPVSGSVQFVASNDGVNWATVGSAVASGTGIGSANSLGSSANAPYRFWGGYVTAISGTGAIVSANLCA